MQEAVKGATPEELKSDENLIKVTALKTTSNISTLIRDLFHTPPSFKSKIQLSWVVKKIDKSPTKRHAPITFGAEENGKAQDTKGAKSARNSTDGKVYSPPSGKYSGKVQNYTNSSKNNGGGRNNSNRSRNSGGGGFRSANRNRNFRRY